MRNFFYLSFLAFFACSDDSPDGDLLDGIKYEISEKEDCNGVEYNPKIQFCSETGVIKDKESFIDERDGQKYEYVTIGSQVWMAKNLNYEIADSKCYDNDLENCEKCGRLYNWFMATTENICPEGWRLPNEDDWNTLNRTAGDSPKADDRLVTKTGWKSCSWNENNCTDSYGFSALACGSALYFPRDNIYSFKSMESAGYFWSSTESYHSYNGHNFDGVYYYAPGSLYEDGDKQDMLSIRCIKKE